MVNGKMVHKSNASAQGKGIALSFDNLSRFQKLLQPQHGQPG